jgi:hypothetical protein
VEPEGDGAVLLSVCARVHVRERVISEPEHSVFVQEVLRPGRKTANGVIECAAENLGRHGFARDAGAVDQARLESETLERRGNVRKHFLAVASTT